MSLTEKLKLRCMLSECRGITVPNGTDFSNEADSGVVPAGTVKAFDGVIGIAADDIDLDGSDLSTKPSYWLTFIPEIIVTKVAHATDRPWTLGETIFYDGTQAAFTDLSTNLAGVGVALEAALSTATEGLIRFNGENAAITPDVDASS